MVTAARFCSAQRGANRLKQQACTDCQLSPDLFALLAPVAELRVRLTCSWLPCGEWSGRSLKSRCLMWSLCWKGETALIVYTLELGMQPTSDFQG